MSIELDRERPLIAGIGLGASASFHVDKLAGQGFMVESLTFDIDDYFMGRNGFDGRQTILSGVQYPACATASMDVSGKYDSNDPGFGDGTRNQFSENLVACDYRWTADKYTGGDTWASLQDVDTQITCIDVELFPESKDSTGYSFYDYISDSFRQSAALHFNAKAKLALPPWDYEPDWKGCGLMMVLVPNALAEKYEILRWQNVTTRDELTVYVQRGQIRAYYENPLMGETPQDLSVGWVRSLNTGVPTLVGVRYKDSRTNYVPPRLELYTKSGSRAQGANPLNVTGYDYRVSSRSTLEPWVMWGDEESSVEVLDISMWRDGLTDDAWNEAIGGYEQGYGL